MKIDAHQHFWHYNDEEYSWMGAKMDALKRDYLPAHLHPLLTALDMGGTVAVQARQTLEETRWLLELADKYDFIKGVVGWVDLRSDRVEEQLELFSIERQFVGVRHVVEDEPETDFILGNDFVRGVQLLGSYGLTYDLLVRPNQLQAASELVDLCPDQPFVLDHLAKPPIALGAMNGWEEDIRRLAQAPTVYCKLSGMVTEADWQHWQLTDLRPYIDVVYDAFGPDRLMLGSDWPVCTLAGSYAQVIDVIADYCADQGPSASDILGDNAIRFYGLGEMLSDQ